MLSLYCRFQSALLCVPSGRPLLFFKFLAGISTPVCPFVVAAATKRTHARDGKNQTQKPTCGCLEAVYGLKQPVNFVGQHTAFHLLLCTNNPRYIFTYLTLSTYLQYNIKQLELNWSNALFHRVCRALREIPSVILFGFLQVYAHRNCSWNSNT